MMIRLDDGSWGADSLARMLVDTAQNGTAATFITDTEADGRYVVGVTDQRFNDLTDTADVVRRVSLFIDYHSDTADGFGVWVSDSGEVCVDAVVLVSRYDYAMYLGRAFNQEEVYDSVLDTCLKV